MKDDYKSFLLNCKSDEGINLFINDGGDVVENPDYITTGSGTASPVFKNYYENAYKPYINEHLQNYLVTAIPGYLNLNKYIFNVLLFAEILPSFVIGLILTYFVPTLIFSRGRMTFGKKIYRIGLLDDRCLSPSLLRTLARFGVIVLEFALAIPTFCVSFLISFSMMAFSKSKQSVPDYVAGVNEILILENKIYKNFNELDLDNIDVHKEPVKFTTKNFD